MPKACITYSDGALAHTYKNARKPVVLHESDTSKHTVDTVHFWGKILPNAVPVNGGSIVSQIVLDNNFCHGLAMDFVHLAAWELPISSPQQASDVIVVSAIKQSFLERDDLRIQGPGYWLLKTLPPLLTTPSGASSFSVILRKYLSRFSAVYSQRNEERLIGMSGRMVYLS